MNTPDDASDTQINRLVEGEPVLLDLLRDMVRTKIDDSIMRPVNAEAILSNAPYGVHISVEPESHPLATWLFKNFRVGNQWLEPRKAFEIGNELNRLMERVAELERGK